MLGKLVRVTRASIGVPKGTLGLIVKKYTGAIPAGELPSVWTEVWTEESDFPPVEIYTVLLCRAVHHERRYLERDLEVVEV